jgi:hypothetical protein
MTGSEMVLPFFPYLSRLHETAGLLENLKSQKALQYKPFMENMLGIR